MSRLDVANLSLDDRRRVIAESVVSAMLATLAAERVAELNRVGLRAALERLALTQARLKFGQGTALDVDRAQQDVAVGARAAHQPATRRCASRARRSAQRSARRRHSRRRADLDLDGFETRGRARRAS